MQQLDRDEYKEAFLAPEGSISMIYGLIGSGKTTEGVRRIVRALEEGRIVYTNIPLRIDEILLDERLRTGKLISGITLTKSVYFNFARGNYRYVEVDDFDNTAALVTFLSDLKDCLVIWDEGWYLFDSYEGTDFAKSKRQMILHTRHHSRELIVIAQRPTSIQVTARGMVNRFYKCEKVFQRWGFIVLRVSEIQEMETAGSIPDETKIVSRKFHFLNNEFFRVFDTHYLRGGAEFVYPEFEVWKLSYLERIRSFLTRPKKT